MKMNGKKQKTMILAIFNRFFSLNNKNEAVQYVKIFYLESLFILFYVL